MRLTAMQAASAERRAVGDEPLLMFEGGGQPISGAAV